MPCPIPSGLDNVSSPRFPKPKSNIALKVAKLGTKITGLAAPYLPEIASGAGAAIKTGYGDPLGRM